MAICEALLITMLFAMFVHTSVTDCKKSYISNKLLAYISGLAVIIDLVYYLAFAKPYFLIFVKNSVLLYAVGILFYCFHLWAAGDSKLLFVASLCIPGRFYSFRGENLCTSFLIIVLVFSLAFLYIVMETIVVGIKSKNLFQFGKLHIDWKRQIGSFLAIVSATELFTFLLNLVTGKSLSEDIFLATAISFLFVLSIIQLQDRVSTKILYIWAITSWIFIIGLAAFKIIPISFSQNLRVWVLVLAIMLVRLAAEKYNYQSIETGKVKAGQILSAATVLRFSLSRVRGLPTGITEDLRSRISSQEAESVRRWEKSSNGQPYVVIVRKIPFAIFISLGITLFLIIEGLILWRI